MNTFKCLLLFLNIIKLNKHEVYLNHIIFCYLLFVQDFQYVFNALSLSVGFVKHNYVNLDF